MSTTEQTGAGRPDRALTAFAGNRASTRLSSSARLHLRAAVLIGVAVMLASGRAGAVLISTTPYSFSTQNQSLTEPGASNVTVLPFSLPIGGSIVPRTTEGEIKHVNVSGIDNSAGQAVYDSALSTCTGKSVAGVHPTAAECRSGRVMRGCTAIGCVINEPIPGVSGGLGDRPPATITKSFDVGMQATYEATLKATLQGELVLAGGGGVGDVTYSGTGVVTSDAERAAAGDRV